MSDHNNDDLVKSFQNAIDDTVITSIAHMGRVASFDTSPTHEPIVVRARPVESPLEKSQRAPIEYASCNTCGYVHKSLEGCARCERLRALDAEAGPYHKTR